MHFKMDEQTYRDLNVFGGSEYNFSLFGLFKKTKTVGGTARLQEMMRSPINDLHVLRNRSEAIDFLVKSPIKLDINHDQFDLILHYLNYDRGQLRNNLMDSLWAWTSNWLKPNQNYYTVQLGISYLLPLLAYAEDLIPVLQQPNCPLLLKKLGSSLEEILAISAIKYARSLAGRKRFTFHQLAKLDVLLRKENRLVLQDLLHVFYELDALSTVAATAARLDFCLPTYIDSEQISVQLDGLFHPAIPTPTCNNFHIDQKKLVFLSGSNMAGKSSLLKSVGIAVYLAHLGFPVPAKQMQTVIFNGLLSTINLADNIENGLSHYFSEVMSIKKVASLLTEQNRMFVILDELFKGTNARDAFEASLLVINGLARIESSVFIISSHITELAPSLNNENIRFQYLAHQMIDKKPHFTYQLKDGVANDGIGMYFIENENIAGLLEQAISKQ
jgi:DNA mismatch repair protein MutS